MRPFLTVLTRPVASAPVRMYRKTRAAIRPFVKPGVPLPKQSIYPGHEALVRSVVQGLGAIGADFNFNPRSYRDIAKVVYAPSNDGLNQALRLKKRGALDHLVAGPVNAFLPREGEGLLLRPEIDQLIVPSEWVLELYRDDSPELLSKTDVCPAGVDVQYWRPGQERDSSDHVVVYVKNAPDSLVRETEEAVRQAGLAPRLLRYGTYRRSDYRKLLLTARLGVFLSPFETQGLALAEAWAMDVPTVVWDPQGETEWRGFSFRSRSSCPYLTAQTGLTFKTLPELSRALGTAGGSHALSPRRWVLENMTDAVCAEKLYRAVQSRVRSRTGAMV